MPDPVDDFRAAPHPHARGRSAEAAAVAWLERRGYFVVARNHETAAGEIDLVAHEGDTLCFVEIKAVLDPRFGSAIARVDRKKQRRLARCAALFLADFPWKGPCRFDVLGLEPGQEGWRFELVQGAFEAS